METILEKIIFQRKKDLESVMQAVPMSEIQKRAASTPVPPAFSEALTQPSLHPHIIAEVKKASPSKGIICKNFNHLQIAKAYQAGGASALSVLTEEKYFLGRSQYLKDISNQISLPLLRKDFIIHPYQIIETRAMGASAFLLIVDCLTDAQLSDFIQLGQSLSLTALVEVHRDSELRRALACKSELIGINNRNLRTFETSLNTTLKLRPSIPNSIPVVSESGIHSPEDITLLKRHNIQAVLMGEAFTRNPETIQEKMSSLIRN